MDCILSATDRQFQQERSDFYRNWRTSYAVEIQAQSKSLFTEQIDYTLADSFRCFILFLDLPYQMHYLVLLLLRFTIELNGLFRFELAIF